MLAKNLGEWQRGRRMSSPVNIPDYGVIQIKKGGIELIFVMGLDKYIHNFPLLIDHRGICEASYGIKIMLSYWRLTLVQSHSNVECDEFSCCTNNQLLAFLTCSCVLLAVWWIAWTWNVISWVCCDHGHRIFTCLLCCVSGDVLFALT